MIKSIGGIPVRTRVPLPVWAVAAVVAVASTAATFATVGPDRDLSAPAAQSEREICRASVS